MWWLEYVPKKCKCVTDKVSIKLAMVRELEFADKLTERICTCDNAKQTYVHYLRQFMKEFVYPFCFCLINK